MIGYCDTEYKQISIYEYMPGGTLQHLHGEGLLDSKILALDWKTRLKIALHIMQGLKQFPTGGFKLFNNNIFLTENWVPKIGKCDFFWASVPSWYVLCSSPCFSSLYYYG
jgi:hypothetical protein